MVFMWENDDKLASNACYYIALRTVEWFPRPSSFFLLIFQFFLKFDSIYSCMAKRKPKSKKRWQNIKKGKCYKLKDSLTEVWKIWKIHTSLKICIENVKIIECVFLLSFIIDSPLAVNRRTFKRNFATCDIKLTQERLLFILFFVFFSQSWVSMFSLFLLY